MSQRKKAKRKKARPENWWRATKRTVQKWAVRAILGLSAIIVGAIFMYAIVNPPITLTMFAEKQRLGDIDYQWVPIEEVAPSVALSVVAAEDANYCQHWGFDMQAIRAALEDGANRGASTISQQTVKNVYLWQNRSWIRKAIEAVLTPMVELVWSKKRILEVYLNVAEFDEGVFGVEAAARHYFGVGPDALSSLQAARLAAVLPSPKTRSASRPNEFLRRRTAQIQDGAATIEKDGRAACFQ